MNTTQTHDVFYRKRSRSVQIDFLVSLLSVEEVGHLWMKKQSHILNTRKNLARVRWQLSPRLRSKDWKRGLSFCGLQKWVLGVRVSVVCSRWAVWKRDKWVLRLLSGASAVSCVFLVSWVWYFELSFTGEEVKQIGHCNWVHCWIQAQQLKSMDFSRIHGKKYFFEELLFWGKWYFSSG